MTGHGFSVVVLLAGVLRLAGCGDTIEDIDDAADILTGAEYLKVGREVEQRIRRISNDHRDTIDKYVGATRDFGEDDDDDEDDEDDEDYYDE